MMKLVPKLSRSSEFPNLALNYVLTVTLCTQFCHVVMAHKAVLRFYLYCQSWMHDTMQLSWALNVMLV